MSGTQALSDIPAFPVAEFAAFCRAKAPDGAYDYHDGKLCALGQFGYPDAFKAGSVPEVVLQAVSRNFGDTWGGLADRLESLISDRPSVEKGE